MIATHEFVFTIDPSNNIRSRVSANDMDGAYDLIEFIISELNLPVSAVVKELSDPPQFKPLVDDPRFSSLKQRAARGDAAESP